MTFFYCPTCGHNLLEEDVAYGARVAHDLVIGWRRLSHCPEYLQPVPDQDLLNAAYTLGGWAAVYALRNNPSAP